MHTIDAATAARYVATICGGTPTDHPNEEHQVTGYMIAAALAAHRADEDGLLSDSRLEDAIAVLVRMATKTNQPRNPACALFLTALRMDPLSAAHIALTLEVAPRLVALVQQVFLGLPATDGHHAPEQVRASHVEELNVYAAWLELNDMGELARW